MTFMMGMFFPGGLFVDAIFCILILKRRYTYGSGSLPTICLSVPSTLWLPRRGAEQIRGEFLVDVVSSSKTPRISKRGDITFKEWARNVSLVNQIDPRDSPRHLQHACKPVSHNQKQMLGFNLLNPCFSRTLKS